MLPEWRTLGGDHLRPQESQLFLLGTFSVSDKGPKFEDDRSRIHYPKCASTGVVVLGLSQPRHFVSTSWSTKTLLMVVKQFLNMLTA